MKNALKILEKVTVCNDDMREMKKPPHYLGVYLTLEIAGKMESYAEKQATEFAEWVWDEYEMIYINDEIKYKSQSDDEHEGFPFFTMEQLYQRFKEEQK